MNSLCLFHITIEHMLTHTERKSDTTIGTINNECIITNKNVLLTEKKIVFQIAGWA